jgi:hypothetical protein
MTKTKPKRAAEPFDDNIFEYGDTGLRQNIANFARNALEMINGNLDEFHELDTNDRVDARESIKWHVNELVRWCRGFNAENHELKTACKMYEAIRSRIPGTVWREAEAIAHADRLFDRAAEGAVTR